MSLQEFIDSSITGTGANRVGDRIELGKETIDLHETLDVASSEGGAAGVHLEGRGRATRFRWLAQATTTAEAERFGDVVVVSVPFGRYRELPTDAVAGKVAIDTNNYYPQRDGHFEELDSDRTTSSELLQAHLPGARVVKAFNAIQWMRLRDDGRRRRSRAARYPHLGRRRGSEANRRGADRPDRFRRGRRRHARGGRNHQTGAPAYTQGVPTASCAPASPLAEARDRSLRTPHAMRRGSRTYQMARSRTRRRPTRGSRRTTS
jgi:hypothetical protein